MAVNDEEGLESSVYKHTNMSITALESERFMEERERWSAHSIYSPSSFDRGRHADQLVGAHVSTHN